MSCAEFAAKLLLAMVANEFLVLAIFGFAIVGLVHTLRTGVKWWASSRSGPA